MLLNIFALCKRFVERPQRYKTEEREFTKISHTSTSIAKETQLHSIDPFKTLILEDLHTGHFMAFLAIFNEY